MKAVDDLSKRLDNLACALIEGLIAHETYKQYFLQKALKILAGKEFYDGVKAEFGFLEGIEP